MVCKRKKESVQCLVDGFFFFLGGGRGGLMDILLYFVDGHSPTTEHGLQKKERERIVSGSWISFFLFLFLFFWGGGLMDILLYFVDGHSPVL